MIHHCDYVAQDYWIMYHAWLAFYFLALGPIFFKYNKSCDHAIIT